MTLSAQLDKLIEEHSIVILLDAIGQNALNDSHKLERMQEVLSKTPLVIDLIRLCKQSALVCRTAADQIDDNSQQMAAKYPEYIRNWGRKIKG